MPDSHVRQSSTHDVHNYDAVYRPIPQAPVASEPARPSLELDTSDEQVELVDELASSTLLAEEDTRIHGIHFILGCAVLLPWNALITATPYFLSRLDGSPLKSTFSSYLSTTFMASNLGFLARATATSKQSSNSRRVLLSMSWLAFLSATLYISTFIRPHPGVFFAFVLVNGILQAAAGSYLQTAVVAVASLFGHRTMQAVMSGQAGVGVVVSGVQVLSATASTRGKTSPQSAVAPGSKPEEVSAAIFFALSTLFLVASAGVHVWMTRLPVYQSVLAQSSSSDRMGSIEENDMSESMERLIAEEHNHGRRKLDEKPRIFRLAKVNLPYNFAVAYVFAVTLAVFPPITISIQSTNPSTHPLLFSAVHFLIYNIGDFVGRYLCSFPRLLVWSARRLLAFSISRTLFIPLFLMCNIQWASSSTVPSTPIINSDWLYMFILLLFGLTGGYVSSMCMMSAPSVAHNPRLQGRTKDVDVAATVAAFCLVGGLTFGSVASFAVRAAVCDCNPFGS
ncbi:hypothetical protein SCP_0205600 [Sparassis crispa]|uniref:Equilibrative nucleoside transporter 1 n=1 Tax=Sparassis crispa TaxID=139825 RepID=A0A401GB24_9APHY|nr:hypothetical protein SCP_0205600 [Sparassis crispa]GBE79362.1 hypothetical protein SCP_0205600 [Sparassis crispa]